MDALWRTGLLDTPPEPAFDRLTRLVQQVLGVPVALMCLVDAERQFFKSAVGLPEPWASRRETPLSHSFCQHVVAQETPLVVEDARHHPLVHDNLAIPDLSVIAYLGVPLRAPDGTVIGAVCAIQDTPRRWTEQEVQVARDLSEAIASEMAARYHARQRQAAEEQMLREKEQLSLLVEVQQTLAGSQMAVQPLMRLVARQTLRLVPHADGTAVLGVEPEGLVMRAAAGVATQLEGRCLSSTHSLAGRALASGHLLRADDATLDARVDAALCREVGIRSMIAVPLHYREVPLGVLCVVSVTRNHAFTEAEVHNLRLLSGSLAAVMGHAQAFEEKERALAQRTRDLEALAVARDAAEAAVRAKSAFLGRMSHEIRTPMNGILGLSQVLAEMELPSEAKTYVDMIGVSGDALMKVLDDVLDMSKLEAGRLALEPAAFSLGDLVEQAMELMTVTAERKGLTLRCTLGEEVPEHVVGDRHRLRQVLLNLLDNAVKFTPEGVVSLDVSAHRSAAEHLTLTFRVTDTGTGIAPETQAQLFDPFTQGDDSAARRHGGAGLGLALVQRLVHLMDGDVKVNSVPGQGTTFVCRVQVGVAAEEAAPAQAWPRHVLVLDERPADGLPVLRQLTAWGASVSVATSLPEAMAQLWTPGASPAPCDLVVVGGALLHDEAAFFPEMARALPGRADLAVLAVYDGEAAPETSSAAVLPLKGPLRPAQLRQVLASLQQREPAAREAA